MSPISPVSLFLRATVSCCLLASTFVYPSPAASGSGSFPPFQRPLIDTNSSLRDNPSIEPYVYLQGGSFSNNPQPLSPDPLVQYQWTDSSVNTTALQIFDTLPIAVTVLSNPSSFTNLSSCIGGQGPTDITVTGTGSFMIDFGTESAAWLEIDSPDLDPTEALALLVLGISEYNEIEKQGTPKNYPLGGTSNGNTYRLETNNLLYEGVRFGFVNVTNNPSSPFHITAIRAVSQTKVVNYTGSFNSSGTYGQMLTTIWYTAAYTVRLNLEEDYFGAILMDRGDRISWTGDAHVAQATSLIAFGNADFVKVNIDRTANDCNNIETYCLYWVLSVLDWWRTTNNNDGLIAYIDNINNKLEHAYSIFTNPTTLSFVGWDDRLGSGFANASTVESQWLYRLLSIRVWNEYAAALTVLGNTTLANHFTTYATTMMNTIRQGNTYWYTILGVHAGAEAVNTLLLTTDETAYIYTVLLNNSVTICSYSNFNQYWILQALYHLGAMDRAYSAVVECWGTEIRLGATSFWEISAQDWDLFDATNNPVPYGYNGATSFCHPWSAAPTVFLSRYGLGVQHYKSLPWISNNPDYPIVIRPFLASMDMDTLEGKVPIGIDRQHVTVVAVSKRTSTITVELPDTYTGLLIVSEVLMEQLGWDISYATHASIHSVRACWTIIYNDEPLPSVPQDMNTTWSTETDGPLDRHGKRSYTVHVSLPKKGTYTITSSCLLSPTKELLSSTAINFPPFPSPIYPARLIEIDDWTQGNWINHYGNDGYVLFNYGGTTGNDLVKYPTYIASVTRFDSQNDVWTEPNPAMDPRALQNPFNTSDRSIGVIYNTFTTAVDIDVTNNSNNPWYQIGIYCVDYDNNQPSHESFPPRRQVVNIYDRSTLNPILPTQYLHRFDQGVWIIVQYNASLRVRVSQLPGDNGVLSAIVFDSVN